MSDRYGLRRPNPDKSGAPDVVVDLTHLAEDVDAKLSPITFGTSDDRVLVTPEDGQRWHETDGDAEYVGSGGEWLVTKGEKGDTGATGADGAAGATGADGAKGDKGDKGDTGDTGATGPSGSVSTLGILRAGVVSPGDLAFVQQIFSPGPWSLKAGSAWVLDTDGDFGAAGALTKATLSGDISDLGLTATTASTKKRLDQIIAYVSAPSVLSIAVVVGTEDVTANVTLANRHGAVSDAGVTTAVGTAAWYRLTDLLMGRNGSNQPTVSNAEKREWAGGEVVLTQTLPASFSGGIMPADKSEVYYAADEANGIVWKLRARIWNHDGTANASAFIWDVLGPATLFSAIEASENTASGTYTDLATVGPAIQVALAGDYELEFGANIGAVGGTATPLMSVNVVAGAASDALSAFVNTFTSAQGASVMRKKIVTLAALATATAKYRSAAGTGSFSQRWLRLTPKRVTG